MSIVETSAISVEVAVPTSLLVMLTSGRFGRAKQGDSGLTTRAARANYGQKTSTPRSLGCAKM